MSIKDQLWAAPGCKLGHALVRCADCTDKIIKLVSKAKTSRVEELERALKDALKTLQAAEFCGESLYACAAAKQARAALSGGGK